MKIIITYDLPSAAGLWHTHAVVADSLEKAEELCEEIESVGYILRDVTQDVYDG